MSAEKNAAFPSWEGVRGGTLSRAFSPFHQHIVSRTVSVDGSRENYQQSGESVSSINSQESYDTCAVLPQLEMEKAFVR